MSQMKAHMIVDDSDGPATDIAWVTPAKQKDVEALLAKPATGDDNRSNWVWIRLRDGTLALGVFPQGDTYMEYSDNGVCDFGDDA